MDRSEIEIAILDQDALIQDLFRTNWPESWLQINLPLGSTRALFAIAGGTAQTPGRVAEMLGVSRTTVTGLVDRLEAEGLVTRRVDPTDRRCWVLELTPAGRALIDQVTGHRRVRLHRALAALAPGALADLHRGLAALAEAMQASDATQPPEPNSDVAVHV